MKNLPRLLSRVLMVQLVITLPLIFLDVVLGVFGVIPDKASVAIGLVLAGSVPFQMLLIGVMGLMGGAA